MKRLIVFDLDGTLAESKSPIDSETANLISSLLKVAQVSVISGGSWNQFQTQFLSHLSADDSLRGLSILPTCGTQFYVYDGAWKRLYSEDLSDQDKTKIIAALNAAKETVGIAPEKTWGEQIEDRGSQITFSGLGQKAPLEEKSKWDPDLSKRKKMKAILDGQLADFAVRIGGSTSIDVTLPGIDKAYGIGKLQEVLKVFIKEILFVGDALFEGGNDYPVIRTGADTIHVRDPHETKRVIEAVVSCLSAWEVDGRP